MKIPDTDQSPRAKHSQPLRKRVGRRPSSGEREQGASEPIVQGVARATDTPENWLPWDPMLLRLIVRALTARIEKRQGDRANNKKASERNKREARWVQCVIRSLHQITYNLTNLNIVSELPRAGKQILRRLASGRWNNLPHIPQILRIQRHILLEFMKTNHYEAHSFLPQECWLLDYHKQLQEALDPWWCVCGTYPPIQTFSSSYDDELFGKRFNLMTQKRHRRTEVAHLATCDFSGIQNARGRYELSEMDAVHRILAKLHRTTPREIANLLKPIPYIIRRRKVRKPRS